MSVARIIFETCAACACCLSHSSQTHAKFTEYIKNPEFQTALQKNADPVVKLMNEYYTVYNNGNPVWDDDVSHTDPGQRHRRTENKAGTAFKVCLCSTTPCAIQVVALESHP